MIYDSLLATTITKAHLFYFTLDINNKRINSNKKENRSCSWFKYKHKKRGVFNIITKIITITTITATKYRILI